jgi:hypothetical protein
MAASAPDGFSAFAARAHEVVGAHPVVLANPYTTWFSKGEATRGDVRHLTVQFSVFSHLFIEAQLRKVINAPDLDAYRAGKEILLNELGVAFRAGTVDRGTFRFGSAHFEWLLDFARPLGLRFDELGKRRHGTPSTLWFCDELLRWYGAEDPSTGAGASFGVEHWAAAGFWKDLIAGLGAFKKRECPDLPLGFWTFHDALEDQHAAHTTHELRDEVDAADFEPDRFLEGASRVLDGVYEFWRGLDEDRRRGVTA